MRGFSARNDIFVDGVRDVGPHVARPFNLEQVEVIKGPTVSDRRSWIDGRRDQHRDEVAALALACGRARSGLGIVGLSARTVDVNQPRHAGWPRSAAARSTR